VQVDAQSGGVERFQVLAGQRGNQSGEHVARAAGLCTEFERDLFNARAREEIALFEAERLEYALSVLRETDRSQVAA